MSTQKTAPAAVQQAHDTFYRIQWGAPIHDESHAKYMIERINPYKRDQGSLFYTFRRLQVLNCRAVNLRYSHNPDFFHSLKPAEKVKCKPARDSNRVPAKAELMQTLKTLQHLRYNLDDFEKAQEDCNALIEALSEYIFTNDTDYKQAGWGYVA